MAKPQVKLDIRALNALMTSAPVQSMVDERARRIAATAGPNYEAVSRPHRWTARAFVQTVGAAGARDEARSKRLAGALNAGR